MRLLNNEEREQLYHRYRESDLYCHWSPILNQLEWEEEELSAIDIWWLTELMLQKLRDVDFQRDEMIPYLFKNLLKSMESVSADGKEIRRSVGLAENSAVTAMCVLMYPDMKSQMSDVSEMFSSMGNFTQAFGMDQLNRCSLEINAQLPS